MDYKPSHNISYMKPIKRLKNWWILYLDMISCVKHEIKKKKKEKS